VHLKPQVTVYCQLESTQCGDVASIRIDLFRRIYRKTVDFVQFFM